MPRRPAADKPCGAARIPDELVELRLDPDGPDGELIATLAWLLVALARRKLARQEGAGGREVPIRLSDKSGG
jgi:hypothetical protein